MKKGKRADGKKSNKILMFSIVLNVLLLALTAVLILNKFGILTRTTIGSYSYSDNPQYDANLTMFKFIDGDADVVFAGDSITANGRFSEFFPEANVMNRGIGSDTTERLYYRLDEIISRKPKKLFIMVGINDIARNMSKEDSLKYYELIISEVSKELPDCEIYVQSILPTVLDNYSIIRERNESIKKMCEEHGIKYINLYDKFLIGGKTDDGLLSADGVHLNGNGYSIWIDAVKEYVYSK